ncbi:alpha/beta hydrolase [Trichocoleus sp. FACHB-591]|uniref:alpha/beta hydrolase n=1 Tax=Trichocoleus sp. FACHB-591 TaxID=2692872 RepID=UPI001685B84B|nr:alpha/beta hydrolase [Trichocoleus sp. FACHB-591]MBD2097643.1 alpha/beta hydrolase [Trichocoleus sp. FACHB-591]
MVTRRFFDSLPFSWEGKSAETIQNDCRWLEFITRNAAPFSDWWTKARIVQLAYPTPPHPLVTTAEPLPTYAGLGSEAAIAEVLQSLCSPEKYPDFHRKVNVEFVTETLNCWKLRQFSQAISRNFEVYADLEHPNTFLVTSTAPVSLEVDRQLPPSHRFRPLFNVDEFARIVQERDAKRLSLRTHGYSSPASGFYESFTNEADELNRPDPATHARTLQDDHFYIGYQWPSEQPVTSPGLWADYRSHLGIVFKFLFVVSGIAGIFGTLLYIFLKLFGIPVLKLLGLLPGVAQVWEWTDFVDTVDLAVQWYWIVPTIFLLWTIVFLLLRVVVYLRDRYRAIHYGAPDLAEFFWRLDRALSNLAKRSTSDSPQAIETNAPTTSGRQLSLNLIGHSMGGLLVVTVLRILSDRFGKDDQGSLLPDPSSPVGEEADSIGEHLRLDTLILASPDIPLEFMREGRNNYVRSAMRRCRRIYLMSSDRDIVLRYLSTVSNWFSEPSIQMAGMRLGNLYLKPIRVSGSIQYRPYIRIMVHSERAVQPTSSYELFRKFNYLDCSEMRGDQGTGGVNAVAFSLNRFNGLLIDLINTTLFLFGIKKLDVHGGYFQTNTQSFQILKFLLTANFLADEVIKGEIEAMIAGTPIKFLPSESWVMPTSTADSTVTGA